MWKTLGDNIYTAVSSLTSTEKINIVYNYEDVSFTKLPSVSVFPGVGGGLVRQDTVSWNNRMVYNVRIADEYRQESISVVEDKIRDLVDKVVNKIITDTGINTARNSLSINVNWNWNSEPSLRFADVVVIVNDLVC